MSDRGLTQAQAFEFDRLQEISILREKRLAEAATKKDKRKRKGDGNAAMKKAETVKQ